MTDLARSMLHRLRFKHLRALEVLGRAESMRAATVELNLTQPAITKLLQDLEELLQVKVFERSSTGVTPTPIGRAVLEFSRHTVSDIERFAGLITNLKLGGYGSLRIGAIMASLHSFVPNALRVLKEERPLMTIHLMAAPSDQLLDELRNGTIDLAVARLTDPDQSVRFDFVPLLDEEVWVFVDASHPLANDQPIEIASLFDEPWVLQSPMTPLRRLVQQSFATSGLGALPNWIETDSIYATLKLVQQAKMIAALPRRIVEDEVKAGRMVRLSVPLAYQLDQYGIVALKDSVQSENTLFFLEILRRTARDTTD